ncbi:MAG: [LysW]-lysine hydrolase [Anaerolineaceae bacterium]|nr:[LysW]-lysine hydrolase [Anaerolineaceae bacterium]
MIENSQISETLSGLLACYSPSGHEEEAVDFLVRRMKALGFDQSFKDEVGNAIGIIGSGETTLLFLGHIDTVPGFIEPRIENSNIYGRGSVDAKGSLAAFVDAAFEVTLPEDGRIVIIAAVEEEGSSKGAKYIVDKYHPDFAIIGEPSSWDRITLGYKGSVWLKLNFQRDKTHSAHDSLNATELAVSIWNQIQEQVAEYNQDKKRLFSQLYPRLNAIQTDNQEFHTLCELTIECRLPPEFTFQEWQNFISTILNEDGKLSLLGEPVNAYAATKSNALVSSFLGAIRKSEGKPRFVFKTGTSDMNIVAPVWSCPILAYGPGDSALDHTPNEHLSLIEFQRSVVVLKNTLENLFSKV